MDIFCLQGVNVINNNDFYGIHSSKSLVSIAERSKSMNLAWWKKCDSWCSLRRPLCIRVYNTPLGAVLLQNKKSSITQETQVLYNAFM